MPDVLPPPVCTPPDGVWLGAPPLVEPEPEPEPVLPEPEPPEPDVLPEPPAAPP